MSCALCPTPFAQQHLKLLGPPNSGRSVAEWAPSLKTATDACVLAANNASPAQRGPRRDAQPLHATPLAAVLFHARGGLEEQLGELEVALLACNVQRRGAIRCGLGDRRAGLEEQPGNLEVAVPARGAQHRLVGLIAEGELSVDRRASIEEQLGDLAVALPARDCARREGGRTLALSAIDDCAGLEEQLRYVGGVHSAGEHERSVARRCGRLHSCAAIEQQLHRGGLPVAHRKGEEGVAH
mmetsp:Transcript_8402/g.24920  ORF Transcript_8402/g.24920 Transcript_8402/m.24920 type:complete len:240 (-) Transcript_8402:165-884(-)